MSIDPYIVLGAATIGLLVGMTGAGGGALMTPMLILLFSVKPSTAISSDLVAAVLMRPVGAAVHMWTGTVNFRLVGWMTLGSVPAAFAGTAVLTMMDHGHGTQHTITHVLGAALLIGAGAMALRFVLDRRSGQQRSGLATAVQARPLATLAVGMVGGLIVGITSVGSGSLMIIFLVFLYPTLSAKQLVGTDLTQAVPLTLAAALGALVFGHVELGLTASLIVGSVPAVLLGSLLSSRVSDRCLRPSITLVILASGLKYVGVDTPTLGWVVLGGLVTLAAVWIAPVSPWRLRRTRAQVAGATPRS